MAQQLRFILMGIRAVQRRLLILSVRAVTLSESGVTKLMALPIQRASLDDVRIYSRALSAGEIAELAAGNHTTARLGRQFQHRLGNRRQLGHERRTRPVYARHRPRYEQ